MYQEENKLIDLSKAITHAVSLPELNGMQVEMDVLRLDRINPVISGNKWFKLKYYLQEAMRNDHDAILSFGGAYSNHIVATAYAAREHGLPAIGIIRGEEGKKWSHTLKAAAEYGMQLHFITRDAYRQKETESFMLALLKRFGNCYIIPEGGAGIPGVQGSAEILQLTAYSRYTHIVCAVGTGTMFAGLANASIPGQLVIGIPVLKGINNYLEKLMEQFVPESKKINCRFCYDYHFGGYARKSVLLIDFMNRFCQQTGIPTDFVYTGKMFYAVSQLLKQGYFPQGSKIVTIHSGGLQGNLSLPEGTLFF